jgi:hypothetical protein
LAPIHKGSHSDVSTNIQQMLTQIFRTGAARVHLEKLYNPAVFTLPLIQRMFKVDCWTTGLGASLPATTPYMFHAYDLLALEGLAQQNRWLPANGITLSQALHLGRITYYLFSLLMVEPAPLGLSTEMFQSTHLGTRLWDWSLIPTQPDLSEAWPLSPKICAYYWLLS